MLKLRSWVHLGVVAVLPLALAALAEHATAETAVSIDGAWCLTSQYNQHTAFVYMTLTIEDETADALIGAVSPIADQIQILAPDPSGDHKKLEPVSEVPLDPHEPTVLEPTETHLLLKGLNRKLVPGDEFDLKLNFEHAGVQDAVVKVLRYPPSAGMPGLPKGVKVE